MFTLLIKSIYPWVGNAITHLTLLYIQKRNYFRDSKNPKIKANVKPETWILNLMWHHARHYFKSTIASWKHRVSSRKSVIASRTCWTWDTKMSNLRKIYHYFQQGKNCTIWVSFYWKSTIINLIWCQRFSNWIEAWKGYDSNAQFIVVYMHLCNLTVLWFGNCMGRTCT